MREWKIKEESDGLYIKDGLSYVAKLYTDYDKIQANAQLIASAPDTTEALRDLISFLIHDGLGTNVNLIPIINRGTKALKKAGIPI